MERKVRYTVPSAEMPLVVPTENKTSENKSKEILVA